jgi:hypothetical protein
MSTIKIDESGILAFNNVPSMQNANYLYQFFNTALEQAQTNPGTFRRLMNFTGVKLDGPLQTFVSKNSKSNAHINLQLSTLFDIVFYINHYIAIQHEKLELSSIQLNDFYCLLKECYAHADEYTISEQQNMYKSCEQIFKTLSKWLKTCSPHVTTEQVEMSKEAIEIMQNLSK